MITTAPLVCEGRALNSVDAASVGAKAAHLVRLQQMGQPVPAFYAIPTEAFRMALVGAGLSERIGERLEGIKADVGEELAKAAAEIRKWILRMSLPPELIETVLRTHHEMFAQDTFVAVRSSVAGEDGTHESFAGMHDSFLFVRGRERLIETIVNVWASAYNERALAYRLRRGLPLHPISCAVVVQEMIQARTSGVMFTIDPITGNRRRMVINALFGAGEGLVNAGLEADTYSVDRESMTVSSEVAAKKQQLLFDERSGTGLRQAAVPAPLQRTDSLTEEEIRMLARAGAAIERDFGVPQDVEFSFDGEGQLFILQARPVTAVPEDRAQSGNFIIWDNSNIIESYPGVTSPMTFSFIRRAYTIVYQCFAEVMGIGRKKVAQNRDIFENMLGLIRGRVYYNLPNWYRLVRLFPGYDYNRQFMETMMGVKQSTELKEDDRAPGIAQRYLVELPGLLGLISRMSWNFLRIRPLVDRFEQHFRQHFDRWAAMDFRKMAPHELMALYHEMEEKLLWNWKAPIINDFYVMIFYGTLKKLCLSWCGDRSGSLQNDLLCGEGGMESTAPARMLLAMARKAHEDPVLRRRILMDAPETLAREIPPDPRFREFAESLDRYMELYGFRCMEELKLEQRPIRDRPQMLFQVLKNYLGQNGLNAAEIEERERSHRSDAEKRALGSMGFLRRLIFHRVLRSARLGVKNRENLRFARTRIYGLLRDLLREISGRLATEKILDDPEDIFYLALDEVWDYIKGTSVTVDLRALAALRRKEFDAYRNEVDRAPDDRFETTGMVYHRNLFKATGGVSRSSEKGVLQGTGCCPGKVIGSVKVIRTPDEDLRLSGEILVAERTDPGWVILYPSVSGILIERGSLLSHSAVVAREMGIPTIVRISGLLKNLKTGQRVEMDGTEGSVRVLRQSSSAEPLPA